MLKRTFSILGFTALGLVASSTTVFAAHSETATYVDGNMDGLSPNTGGTLLADENNIVFRTGLANVNVSYASVTHSELGAVKETPHGAPLYKIWARGKKTETQLLILSFKNEQGDEKNMTFELAKSAAPVVFSSIRSHSPAGTAVASNESSKAEKHEKIARDQPKKVTPMTSGRPDKPTDPWWGDDYWKTSRNQGDWNQKSSRTELDKAAQQQQQ